MDIRSSALDPASSGYFGCRRLMMLQERSHVNYVWQKMRQDLPTRDVATNYIEVVTCDYEYSMHIILMRRHDFLASAFFEHNFDERNASCRPWITGIGRYYFYNVDYLKEVAYDFAKVENFKDQSLFWNQLYTDFLEEEREQVKFIKKHDYPRKSWYRRK